MAKYILKRLLYILIVFVLLSFIIYCVYNIIPYDMAYTIAKAETDANKNLDINERYLYYTYTYGQDGNIIQRYFRWLGLYPYYQIDTSTGELTVTEYKGLLTGYLGYSFTYSKDVSELISVPMTNTMFLNVFATILGLGITLPLGIVCATKRGSKLDIGVQTATIVGYSIPVFIVGILAVCLFAVIWPIFPVSGSGTLGANFAIYSWEWWMDSLYYLALPLIVMTFCSLGGMTRYVRASMVEALNLDCIRTARAKGLSEHVVIYSHAWRNALIPIVTLVIGWFLGIFSGSIMIENIFGLNGIGKLYYTSLTDKDYEVVLALQMFYVIIGLVGNLVIDILYGFIDPRIRVSK